MKTGVRIVGICLLGLLMYACGGGGSGSQSGSGSSSSSTTTTTTTTTYYGTFQGSKVVGVHYRAELAGVIKEGETDSEGRFQFVSDGSAVSPVTFSVGGVVLGSVTPSVNLGAYSMNVHDLVSSSDPEAGNRAINLYRFLSSINTSTTSGILRVGAATRSALASETVTLHELPLDEFDTRATALVNRLISASALPSGSTLASAGAVNTHLQETKNLIDAARIDTFEITTGADSVLANGSSRVLVQVRATRRDGQALVGGLVHFSTTAGTLGSEADLCDDATTVTTAADKITDANGMAYLFLTPRCQTANAVVSASLGGKIAMKTIQFTPGPPTAANSRIDMNPRNLPADGVSTATVTVVLRDAHDNPVADETTVTLLHSAGTVQGNSVSSTVSGRATFTLVASATNSLNATLQIVEYGFLSLGFNMGGASSTGGKPNSIQMSAGQQQIFVRGVGRTENVSVTIQVRDDVGDAIDETTLGYANTMNNLRVTLRSRPHAGETIAGTGRNANGAEETKTSSDSNNAIQVRTSSGSATIMLTAGIRPGIVEFQVDALDVNGSVLASAVSPLVAIASGHPHSIALSEAIQDGIVNMKEYGRGGTYCRLGSALVMDRYGNAVPDGTAISLSMIDAVLASGAAGSIDGLYLSDASADFTAVKYFDNSGIGRKIQPGDQVLIEKIDTAADRRRFVNGWPSLTAQLLVNETYSQSASNLRYYVGASLRGGAIHGYSSQDGCDPAFLTTGVATTTGGVAPIRVTYPANSDVLQLGCLGYESSGAYGITTVDAARFPNQSGQVMIVASVNDTNEVDASGINLVTKGKFCFTFAAPVTVTTFPLKISGSDSGQIVESFTVSVKDSGLIPVPDLAVECSRFNNNSETVLIELAESAATTPTTGSDRLTVRTDDSGVAHFVALVTGRGSSTDSGSITCTSVNVTGSITVY
ncbi:MAG: hypothetical protein HQM00_14850 [Magnetococcales bacterium]|nr:hypothetical protein [Magnetococcales bacterium]